MSEPNKNKEVADALPSLPDQFVEKVRAIHKHFDKDNDGYLNFEELSNLQLRTSGNEMDGDTYVMVCRTLACTPNQGIGVEALKLTYAADGTDLDDDYRKIFEEVENDVIEAGEGGVFDISS